MEHWIPELTESFLLGQDVFYTQFNDVNFYVEDINQENFYHVTFVKLFPELKIEKIFPLGGKQFVISAAKETPSDRLKVYVLDLDFDDLLGTVEDLQNLFYLDQYSIENYLLEEGAIQKLVIEEKPQLKVIEIAETFDLRSFLDEARQLFSEITCLFAVVQKCGLALKNVDCSPSQFCAYKAPAGLRGDSVEKYKASILAKLQNQEEIKTYEENLAAMSENFGDNVTVESVLKRIPGKYLLDYLKSKLRFLFDITTFQHITIESLAYRLASKCEFGSLMFLTDRINDFIAHERQEL